MPPAAAIRDTLLGDNEQLIDVESYTEARWGVSAWDIEWADLGPTLTDGCE